MIHRRAFTIALLVLSGGAAGLLRAESTPPIAPDSYKQLKFRYIGPVGNRVIAIAGVPGNPNIYYAGAASGGIFKTTDNGAHWDAIFDDQKVSSIGSLAIAPSDPNVVFAGTGESFIRSNISIGSCPLAVEDYRVARAVREVFVGEGPRAAVRECLGFGQHSVEGVEGVDGGAIHRRIGARGYEGIRSTSAVRLVT